MNLAGREPSGIVANGMDLEAEYNNRARVPDHQAIIERWASDAAAFRAGMGGELDLPYGDASSPDLRHLPYQG